VGMDALSNEEKLTLETAKVIREDFLFQNAFDKDDAYTPLPIQYSILSSMIKFYNTLKPIMRHEEFDFSKLTSMKSFKRMPDLKTMKEEKEFEDFSKEVEEETKQLLI